MADLDDLDQRRRAELVNDVAALIRSLENAEGTIEHSREELSKAGYCGDGSLSSMIRRALQEAKRNGEGRVREDLERAWNTIQQLWGLVPDEEGHVVDVIKRRMDADRKTIEALNETVSALRGGEPPPHYCAYCMSRIKSGGDPDHMLACEKAPFAGLTRQVIDALEERDEARKAAEDLRAALWADREAGGIDDGDSPAAEWPFPWEKP